MQVSYRPNPNKTVWVNWQHATIVEQEDNPGNCNLCISKHCTGWLRYRLVSDPTEGYMEALFRLNIQHGNERSQSALEDLKEYYGT